MKREEDYKADLLDDLRGDPEYAAGYLSAAKADSKEAFLVALRNVAEAQMGMQKIAKATKLNRENLYRALSKGGNPSISTLDSVLTALGIETQYVKKHHAEAPSGGSSNTGETIDARTVTTTGGGMIVLFSTTTPVARPIQEDPISVPFFLLARERTSDELSEFGEAE